MTDTPIISADDARKALETELGQCESMVDYYQREIISMQQRLHGYEAKRDLVKVVLARFQPAEAIPAAAPPPAPAPDII
jgi:phage shock protein A